MFVLNKKKYFNEIYCEVFKKSMLAIDDMNNLLTYYGAKSNIEKDKTKFVLATFFFNLFFIEGPLQKKYLPKYKDEICLITEALLNEISKRTGYSSGKVYGVYTNVRETIGNLSLNDEKFKDVDPLYLTAIYYLQFTFKGDYKPEEIGFCSGEVEVAISKIFKNLMCETINYLDSL